MPRFSIIVPVYKVQGFLRECLDSILGQSFKDIEVIAVDDCSPDSCGTILDEYAARDARVRAVHLPENVGLGRARNAGVPHATGDYLLFLDSDDSYTPGALAAIARRLDATEDPDVLVFNHVRTQWWGRGGRSQTADLLAAPGTDTFDILSRPEFLHLFLVAWNKAYRRAFFLEHGFTYSPGLYEDAPVTYQALISARRIACLDRVCVEYRQRRQGAITRTPGRKHFDIFPQYAGLFEFLDRHPELDPHRALLFERMINHFLATLPLTERVLREDRADFYRMTRDFYHRYLPEGFTPPDDNFRRQFRMLAVGPYALYAAYLRAKAVRAAALKAKSGLRKSLSKKVKRTLIRIQHSRGLDPDLAVYSAFSHRGVLGDPAAIYQRAKELAPHIRGVWVVRPEAVASLPPGIDHVTPDSPRYHRLVGRATYFVNNVNWSPHLKKRKGTVHINTHQGTPLKHMGTDLLDRPAATYSLNVRGMLWRSDRWDYSLVANPHSAQVWDRAYPCHFTSLPTGSPRNDVLVTGDPARAAAVRERLGIRPGSKVILYAPTQRDNRKWYLPRLDFTALVRDLGPDFTVLVRLHPQYRAAAIRDLELRDLAEQGHPAGQARLLDVTDEPAVEDLMLASDALVTDYSALMCDYANLDRPIVLHADDWAAYRASRGTYVDLMAQPPGHVTTTTGELAELLRDGRWSDERSAALRSAFRERFCTYDDGHAAARVVTRLMLGEEYPLPVIPQQDAGARDDVRTASV
ncbi:bifunctional glycosyltransferase family 2 protein/CDP-glycerol:glycerophosphate glycerophosphotransferase [Streptomyces sp. T-3]|nr:bifunctional glycosyltransferase family 2 protein/CDP-glycerol:glycerophosphate glycerophosphotransferase [Streptomyces sp. T-3]